MPSRTGTDEPHAPLRLDGAFNRLTFDDWQQAAEASLQAPQAFETLAKKTLDGISVEALYDRSLTTDRWVPAFDETRPLPVRDRRDWDNRLSIRATDAGSANTAALQGLRGGIRSLELRVGAGHEALPLKALDDVLAGVHLDMVSVSLLDDNNTTHALDALLGLCRQRELDPRTLQASLNADPIGAMARQGARANVSPGSAGIDDAFRSMGEIAKRAAADMPLVFAVTSDMSIHHEAGATTVQELVAGIASATRQLELLLGAGLEPAAAARTLLFRISLDANIVDGIVKLRALERLWRHVLSQFDDQGVPVAAPTVVAETSRRHFSILEPWVNHLRNIAACTAAAIADADTIIVHPHNLVGGRVVDDDTDTAERVARNLPLLLAEETGLRDVADAAGGSHAIEALTQATVEAVWSGLGELESKGGLIGALASGRWQASLARTHAERVERLRTGTDIRVGVNRYRAADAGSLEAAIGSPTGDPAETTPGADSMTPDDDSQPLDNKLPRVREAHAFEAVSRETPE